MHGKLNEEPARIPAAGALDRPTDRAAQASAASSVPELLGSITSLAATKGGSKLAQAARRLALVKR
jgi:hypothetical protein